MSATALVPGPARSQAPRGAEGQAGLVTSFVGSCPPAEPPLGSAGPPTTPVGGGLPGSPAPPAVKWLMPDAVSTPAFLDEPSALLGRLLVRGQGDGHSGDSGQSLSQEQGSARQVRADSRGRTTVPGAASGEPQAGEGARVPLEGAVLGGVVVGSGPGQQQSRVLRGLEEQEGGGLGWPLTAWGGHSLHEVPAVQGAEGTWTGHGGHC